MPAPDAAQIRAASQVDFAALGFAEDEALQVLIDESVEFVEWTTGRSFTSMPGEFDAMANKAVRIATGVAAYQEQEDVIETLADFPLISSFSASNYSESRRSLSEFAKTGLICNNPLLHKLLWAMMTDEKRDDAQAALTGENAPAFEVTEVAWGGWQGGVDEYLIGGY